MIKTRRILQIAALSLCFAQHVANADVLEGHIRKEEEVNKRDSVDDEGSETRLSRPPSRRSSNQPHAIDPSPADNETRLARPARDPESRPGNFALKAEDFITNKQDSPDLESESGSRELMLAWELWHKQISREMYSLASRNARRSFAGSGGCRYEYEVTREQRIRVEILESWGDPRCAQAVVEAVQHLDGNPGLTFPAGSKRSKIHKNRTMIWAPNITPGYDWRHGDVEHIIEKY